MQADEAALTQVSDIGAITAQSIVSWFASPQSQHMLRRLREAGVNFESTAALGWTTAFAGMTFVLTGALSLFTRDEATEDRGARRQGLRPVRRRRRMSWQARMRAASCARQASLGSLL